MKKLIAGLLLLGSVSAFASDHGVGSYSVFRLSGMLSGIYQMEIMGFNEATNQYNVRYTTDIDGKVEVEDVVLDSDEVILREMGEMIVDQCETAVGGTKVEMEVEAGYFTTCKMMDEGTISFLGAVPFGVVKSFSNGVIFELVEYQFK